MIRHFRFAAILCLVSAAASLGGDDAPTVERGYGVIEFILRAPESLAPWKLLPVWPDDDSDLPDDITDTETQNRSSWLETLEAIWADGLSPLADLITHSRWSVVQPPKVEAEPDGSQPAPVAAQMAIPLGPEDPLEARLGILTDSLREDYFVFSTEVARAQNVLAKKWLAWSTRLDYRTSLAEAASAKAEQRVSLRLTRRDVVGVMGRLEDRNMAVTVSPLVDLAPAGELYWNHQWLPGLESSLKVRQELPDLQTLWLASERGGVQFGADVRAALGPTTKLDLTGTTTPDLTQYGVRLQLEFLIGVAGPPAQDRLHLAE